MTLPSYQTPAGDLKDQTLALDQGLSTMSVVDAVLVGGGEGRVGEGGEERLHTGTKNVSHTTPFLLSALLYFFSL